MTPTHDTKKSDDAEPGFLVHVFHIQQDDRVRICGVGRLVNGQTFALADDREQPFFFARVADADAVREEAERRGCELRDSSLATMDGASVVRVVSPRVDALRELADALQSRSIRTYEADVHAARHYLVDRDLRGSIRIAGEWRPGDGVDRVYVNPAIEPDEREPELAVLSLDIETNETATRVLAVSLVGAGPDLRNQAEEVHVVGRPRPDDPPTVACHDDERALLGALARRVREIDPDILTGWNVIDFDMRVLQERFRDYGLTFNLGRTRDDSWYRPGRSWGGAQMVVYGRQVLDAMQLVRATLRRYEDYRLGTVARELLGRGKTLEADDDETMPDAIMRAFREDRAAFAEYCLEDARLVRDILDAEDLVRLSVRRSMLTGLPVERAWGSVAAFDFLYIRELHRRGLVAPTTGVDRVEPAGAPGGLVLAPRPGLYRNVLVFDFKSLYPSIIRTFNIDPLAHARAKVKLARDGSGAPASGRSDLLVAPNGEAFDREPGILPALLDVFFERREQAKKEGNDLASYTYKIVMNSFYGVLGTKASRFGAGELAGAITRFGHALLRWTRELLEGEGHAVIYGDTDSVFVDARLDDDIAPARAAERGREIGRWVNEALARHVRETWGVESRLELEFEKHYPRFLAPSMRGDDERGRAKGYAGLKAGADGAELEIVGMEAVRRDWTEMAHRLQRQLLTQMFHDAPAAEMEATVERWIGELEAGRHDDKLVYHKGLRKPVDQYGDSAPAHVKAARLLRKPSGVIHYMMTIRGPQPVGHVDAPIDYRHYIEKQIEPIVAALAPFAGIDVAAAVHGERDLFRQAGFDDADIGSAESP